MNPEGEGKTAGELVLYATSWCGDCALARRFLKSRGIAWREVDVDEDPAADARVMAHNRGTRHLPVLEFAGQRVTASPFDRANVAAWLLRVGAAQPGQVSDVTRTDPDPR